MKIKIRNIFCIVIFVLSVLTIKTGVAQIAPTITVNLSIVPPYSPYCRDYAGLNNNYPSLNNTIVTLMCSSNVQVFLAASITKDDNSISIKVKDTYRPSSSIHLAANIPQVLTGMQLKNIYGGGSLSDLILTGISSVDIMNNRALPEGNYTVCVQARNFVSGVVFGEDCKSIYISYNEPPQILSPVDLSTVVAKYPQFEIVTWSPAVTGLSSVSYRLRIAKLLPGVSATDALRNSAQIILDKSNIITTNYILDLNSGVILDTGNTYAMQVTASSPLAWFKNNGQSEPVVFNYKGNNKNQGNNGINLSFIIPNAKNNIIETNNETPFYINWNWIETDSHTKITKLIDTAYKTNGTVKYVLDVVNSTKNKIGNKPVVSFLYRKVITLANNSLRSYVSFPEKTADSIGFVNSNWYKATVTAYDAQSKIVATTNSVDFQYRNIKDEEPGINISVEAVIKYMFKDSVGTYYNASNTPVEADVMLKAKTPSATIPTVTINNKIYYEIAQKTGTTDAIGAFNEKVKVPLNYITGDSIYVIIKMPDKYYIDRSFPLFAIRAVQKDTLVNFGQLVAETYAYSLKLYVRKAYTSYSISNKNGNMNVALAESTFNSNETPYQFTSQGGGTMIYAVESKQVAAGVTVVMYRKNKQTYIPPVEGNLTDYNHTAGYTEVERGLTQIEKTDSGDLTYVKFNRLLASIFNGDEYYILALNGKNNPDKPTLNTGIHQMNPNVKLQNPQQNNANVTLQNLQNNSGITLQNSWNNFNNPYTNFTYNDDGFIAQEMPYKLALPSNINSDDSLYSHRVANYDIVSTKPPTSLVKGRIMYHWKSDKNNQLRPLANSSFKVVVDYLIDGKPIGSIMSMGMNGNGGSFSELFFVPQGQDLNGAGMELLDHDATMAVGKTDAQGNFEIEVVNINKKGSLGKGTIGSKGGSWTWPTETPNLNMPTMGDIINPFTDGYGYPGSWGMQNSFNQNNSVQNEINGHSDVGFNSINGSFEIGFNKVKTGGGMNKPGMNGPGSDDNYEFPDKPVGPGDKLVDFQRVYRIVPDNQYIYPTKDTFAVQPFDALNIPKPLTSYVKEIKLRVHSTDSAGSDLNQMLITVFRDISDKTPDLPLGEGNGEYKYAALISPQYNNTGEPIDKGNAQNMNTGGNIFNKKFEQLWPAAQDSLNGWAGFTTLLAGYQDYYIESCSDPTGSKTYKATFASVKTDIKDNPDYWLGLASPPQVAVTLKLYPLPSRALIRLIDNSTQHSISGAMGGRVTIKKDGTSSTSVRPVDGDGYVEFLANAAPLSYYTSPVRFEGSASGYNKVKDTAAFVFNATGSQFFYNYLLDPAMRMKGHIVNLDDKNKAGVPSYIKVDSGKVIETDTNGYFKDLPVPGVAGTKIFIIPKDVGFFDTTYAVTPSDVQKANIDLQNFGVFRRRHRIKFLITTTNNYYLNSATVQLGDSIKKTNLQGYAYFNFENVSVNNFTFVIRGPEGQNYIPQTMNLKNKESNDYVTEIVKLQTGSEVDGKVTLDGKAVQHAKVYLDVSQQNLLYQYPLNNSQLAQDANLVVAYSDAAGNYKLRGVPVNNQIVYIHATLDTSFTVNGDIEKADIKNNVAVTNLALTSFKAMLINNLYGFPLSVEKIVPTKPDSSEAKVTGVVHWSKAISNFYLDEVNQVLRIEDVSYKAIVVNGKKVGVPQNSSVTIDGVSSLKFKYLNKYNVKLTTATQGGNYNILNPQPLAITNENDMGVIKGKVSIVDNSFNYPSTYLDFSNAVNNFYLADKVDATTVNTNISAVTSAMSESQINNSHYQNFSDFLNAIQLHIYAYQAQAQPMYYLSNADGSPIQFKLIGFNANAVPVKSFIDKDGKIHLNVNLQCHISNAQPPDFSLNIKDMVLDNNKVYPASSDSSINLALEKWTLIIKNWSFSSEEGGIVSNNGLIHTKAIDIPFSKFVLRNDLFLMDQFQLNNLKMAGGSITLKNINFQNAAIVFDNKTGTDMQPHWRFSISGNPAAELPPLADLSGTIKLNYIQILSNNESVFQLQQQTVPLKIKNNPLALYSPESIYNGPDFISLYGALNVGAPRMGDIPLYLDYKNANSMKPETVQTDFEGQGFVHFVARDPGNNVPNINITSTQLTILGYVVEKPVPAFNEIPSTFFATVGGAPFYTGGKPVYKVEMDHGFVTQLDTTGNVINPKGHKLIIDSGGMAVKTGDWSILTYQGMMSPNNPADNTAPIKVKYAVMGDVSADADGLQVTNIDTPFGKMKMVFDFPDKRMIGSITCNDIPLGASTLSGTIETLFDPGGFYIAGGCSAQIQLPNPYVDGTYNMGFMVGSYPITDELWNVVNSYKNPAVKNDCYRKANPKLTGFYFTIDRIIVDKSIDFDFVLATGYIHATALIGADIYANFKKPIVLGIEAHAFADVAAGLGAITGTSISGSLSALAALKFILTQDPVTSKMKFIAGGSMDILLQASITQSLIATTISESFSIDCYVYGGTEGFGFDLGKGDNNECSN